MSRITVASCAFVHPKDVDLGRVDGNKLSELLDVCVGRAVLALEHPLPGYTDLQRDNLGLKFRCMQSTFRGVRVFLAGGHEQAHTVDALALARITLEDLFSLCLMFEGAQYVEAYLQDGWRKSYVQHLLQAEETQGLSRFDEFSSTTGPANLDSLRRMIGVTDAQVRSIHHDELGVALPPGVAYAPIPQFPTPRRAIAKIPHGDKRRMLERLYFEYGYLCSFAHSLTDATNLKVMFDRRLPFQRFFTDAQRRDIWERTVSYRSFVVAFLSVVQAAAELTALYPADADLHGAAMKAWNTLADGTLLGQAIWYIRTRKLLGVLEGKASTAAAG